MINDTEGQHPFNQNAFIQEVFEAHNICRRRHGVPALRFDQQLSDDCQRDAESLLASEINNDARFPDGGENICIIGIADVSYVPTGVQPVNFWYQQREDVIYGREPFDLLSFNFTQVIWKSTHILGIGVAHSLSKYVIVCHYYPPGNILGEFSENVFPEVVIEQLSIEGNSEDNTEEASCSGN